MKDTKTIKISVTSARDVLNQFASTLATARRNGKIESHTGISFESIEGLRNVLTKRRLELLSAVRRRKPGSVYELSRLLNRDLKSVNTDLKVLEDNDFLELRKTHNGRHKTVPVVMFDRIDISVRV